MILKNMKISTTPRWAVPGSLSWLFAFFVSHIALAIFPGDDPTGDGPWGNTAYLVYDLTLVVISAIGAVLVLGTVRPWGRRFPRRLLLTPLWFGSVLLILRGVPGMIENVLTATGITPHGLLGTINGAEADVGTAEFWTQMAINTYFFAGAIVLLPVTLSFARRTKPHTLQQA